MSSSAYLRDIRSILPRLLAVFDADRTSISYGIGDRYYWAWGLIDFGNGTFQGAAHGMARLWKHGLWPFPTPQAQFLQRIDSLFSGAARLTRKDGSLEEAFPNEGSFCVTALVAFDLLCALDLLQDEIDAQTRTRWLAIIKPMIAYLVKADETHAVISNHLATAVAALARWHYVSPDAAAEARARHLLDRILAHQSDEGWFREYEGADPGYQSLCSYYLADVHLTRPDWQLLEPLRKSLQFLWYFAHPDGSFGGLYGSRCTRFYYPAGVLALASQIPEAASLSAHMAASIERQRVVTLVAMDEPNLVPMFNAYCWAAALAAQPEATIASTPRAGHELTLPALAGDPARMIFSQAGLLVDRGERHYTVISTHKGGVVYHFVDGMPTIQNAGVVVRDAKERLASSQSYAPDNPVAWPDDRTMTISSRITAMPKQLPGPLQFIALRLLCVSLFRIAGLREWVKRQLVRLLITGAAPWPATNTRSIRLGAQLDLSDATALPNGYSRVDDIACFVPIHMASQGYWQVQDEGALR